MAAKALPSPDELRKLLDYDPETGVLTWKPRPVEMFEDGKQGAAWASAAWNARYAGKPAFTANDGQGYRSGDIFNVKHRAHRVAWALHYGEWPADQIDHINGRRDDNRIANLRAATGGENQKNTARPKSNTSGVTGVTLARGLWVAQLGVSGRRLYLGGFANFSDAVAARKAAEREHGFHENHGR